MAWTAGDKFYTATATESAWANTDDVTIKVNKILITVTVTGAISVSSGGDAIIPSVSITAPSIIDLDFNGQEMGPITWTSAGTAQITVFLD